MFNCGSRLLTTAHAAGGPSDPNFSTVMALMHMDATPFVDVRGHTITNNNGVTAAATGAKFGNAGQFNGSNQSLVIAPSANFVFPGDYTIECWITPTALTGGDIIGNLVGSTSADWALIQSSNVLQYYYAGTGSFIQSAAITANVNHHVAIVRGGGIITMYIDGTTTGTQKSSSGNLGDSTRNVTVGARNSGASNFFAGAIDEIRLSQMARYVANFTPPTSPFLNQ